MAAAASSSGSAPPYALSVVPPSALEFAIGPAAASPGDEQALSRCAMTLTHPGGTPRHLAFKVKTTQPRRYLVRPNQGIVAPGATETVSILLVDKDRQVLWDTYRRLGQSALDHSKDKFLVQSCEVPDDFAAQFQRQPRQEGGQYPPPLVEALSGHWNKVAAGGAGTPVFNKKLHLRHVATPAAAPAAGAPPGTGGGALPAALAPSGGGGGEEAASLRRKYDELVAFSVNLTAERDILNNTLEQTKRDLRREAAAREAREAAGGDAVGRRGGPGGEGGGGGGGGRGVSLRTLLAAVLVAALVGIRAANTGHADALLGRVPGAGRLLGLERGRAGKTPKKKRASAAEGEL